MPVIIFNGVNASMAVGTDTFAQDSVMSRYTKGKTSRKVMAISIIGGTVGTGKWALYYGADQIASGLQSTIATDDFSITRDYQPIVDSRWCGPESQMQLIVEEAPGDDIKFIVWLLQAKEK